LCNADEGEPGTFKDRVLLTECPDQVFEGMTIAGYALGSSTGIVYLRGEYAYLRDFSKMCWPIAVGGACWARVCPAGTDLGSTYAFNLAPVLTFAAKKRR